ncbi:MAG: hypothetical protein MJZ66_04515 [Bacteroidales bacterium]|nr:hypothetical protein [Bacteroidales bacterium]
MKRIAKALGLLSIASVLMMGCASEPKSDRSKQDLRNQAYGKTSQPAVSNNYYSLPSPLEVARIVQKTGVEYEPRILHKPELGVRYSTNMAASINLGIYCADLSYSIYFDQKQVALKYLDCIKDLASGLDISDIITQKKMRELEDNISDKDKLLKVVSETFFHSDALLKENSRRPTAVMVGMGMWIESLYISTQLCNADPKVNPALAKTIVEQGLVFEDLLGMLGGLGETSDVAHVKTELEKIKSAYSAIYDHLGGSYVVEGQPEYDAKLFADLCGAVAAVRDSFTQLF